MIARSPSAFKKALPEILEEPKCELTRLCRTLLLVVLERFRSIEAQVAHADGWIESIMKQSVLCQRIAAIPGVGAMTATAMVAAVGDAKAFKNGRHLAAWIGLVPRQNSSGGKSRLLGISKRGDANLRTLLIHGARSVLIRVACKHDARSVWFQDLIARRGYNRATVALANKNARITQSVLSGESNYRPSGVAG